MVVPAQQNNSAGRENSAKPQLSFQAEAYLQQVNKTTAQEICLKLMCEELMMESYLNAAISELQFEERFNVLYVPDGKWLCIHSVSA